MKEQIQRALPELLRTDPAFRDFVLDLTRRVYADRDQTESGFDAVLDELRRDRDESMCKWEESNARFERGRQEIMDQAKKHDRAVGALGAGWGILSERAFRDALAGIHLAPALHKQGENARGCRRAALGPGPARFAAYLSEA